MPVAISEARLDQLSKVAFGTITRMIAYGISYEEAIALFRTLVVLMEQIEKTPDAPDDVLGDLAKNYLREELQKFQEAAS